MIPEPMDPKVYQEILTVPGHLYCIVRTDRIRVHQGHIGGAVDTYCSIRLVKGPSNQKCLPSGHLQKSLSTPKLEGWLGQRSDTATLMGLAVHLATGQATSFLFSVAFHHLVSQTRFPQNMVVSGFQEYEGINKFQDTSEFTHHCFITSVSQSMTQDQHRFKNLEKGTLFSSWEVWQCCFHAL